MPFFGLVIFGLIFDINIVIFEISTLEFVKCEFLTHTVNFGIGSAFCKGLGSVFSVRVRFIKYVFFKAQFSYWPLVWMCHSLSMNKINSLHERCLRIIYDDKTSSFADLLADNGSVTIHTRNLQVLATEMFNVRKNMSTELIQGLFV